MRKALTIILIVLLIISILIAGAWVVSRNKAVKNGAVAPSFRQFLGLGTKQGATGSPGGDLVPDGETPGSNGGTPGGAGGTGSGGVSSDGNVSVSEFTDGPLTPSDIENDVTPGPIDSGNTGNDSTGGGASNPPPTVLPPNPLPPSGTASCTDEDSTIAFTPDEINRLNALQTRFYAVAQTLHTDADVRTELANYDNFKVRADKASDLYNYCVAKAPQITAGAYATRVPTPFWRDATRDRNGYMPIPPSGQSVPLSTMAANPADPRDVNRTQVLLQKIFALNLW